MDDRKDPRNRPAGGAAGRGSDTAPGNETLDWESRALAQVRSRVREVGGPGAAQAGWETDTITRLEDYFDRGEI